MDTTQVSKLKDLHSHILFGVDDGAETLEDSLKIIRQASEDGVTDIVLTPHYIYESAYVSNVEHNKKILKKLKEKVKTENIKVNLYLGNEIYLTDNVLELLKKQECATINETRYVLIELPMHNEMLNAENVIFDLIRNGYLPILAHPERYSYFQDNFEKIKHLEEMGVLFQGNYKSLFGKYGSNAKKVLRRMLKERMITFLSSDVHRGSSYELDKLYKKLKWIYKDKNIITDLLINNFEKVLNNEEIEK